jgi:hypothetical protein
MPFKPIEEVKPLAVDAYAKVVKASDATQAANESRAKTKATQQARTDKIKSQYSLPPSTAVSDAIRGKKNAV